MGLQVLSKRLHYEIMKIIKKKERKENEEYNDFFKFN